MTRRTAAGCTGLARTGFSSVARRIPCSCREPLHHRALHGIRTGVPRLAADAVLYTNQCSRPRQWRASQRAGPVRRSAHPGGRERGAPHHLIDTLLRHNARTARIATFWHPLAGKRTNPHASLAPTRSARHREPFKHAKRARSIRRCQARAAALRTGCRPAYASFGQSLMTSPQRRIRLARSRRVGGPRPTTAPVAADARCSAVRLAAPTLDCLICNALSGSIDDRLNSQARGSRSPEGACGGFQG